MELRDFESIASQLRNPHGDQGLEVGRMMNKGNQLMNLAAIHLLNPRANDHILEIGMGNGFFVKDILEKDSRIHYTGCDISEIMLREAISNNREFIKSGQAEFLKADIKRLPFKNASFNKILTVNTIYFWENLEAVFEEIKRVLTKNGSLIICLRPKSVLDNLPMTQYGFKTFSKGKCIELLSNAGFLQITIDEKEDTDIEISGEKFKNAYLLVKGIKPT